MQKLLLVPGLSILLLAGCAQHKPEVQTAVSEPATDRQTSSVPVNLTPEAEPQAPTMSANTIRIQECRKELDAMQVYGKNSYARYLAEFQTLSRKTDKYMQVKAGIGSDINDIVLPRTQFQIRELCFRIKNRLTQLIIDQS